MLSVYPYGSGSFYTASFALTASFAISASGIDYVFTASNAQTILNPRSGSAAAINVCLITGDQYIKMLESINNYEICTF